MCATTCGPHEYTLGGGERRQAAEGPNRRRLRDHLARAQRARRAASVSITKEIFWLEDEAYIEDIERLGFEPAVLADLRVHHTGGPYYSVESQEKADFWKRWRAIAPGGQRSSGCCSASRASAG